MLTTEALAFGKSNPLTDEDVVRRVVDGDSALFEILMRRHNQRLYRTVRGILRSEEEVADVMQQAYLSAYQHLRQFAGNAKFSTWLTRIAVNESLSRRRMREQPLGVAEEELMMNARAVAPDPEQVATTSELRTMLEREVAALPDSFRVVLMMRDVEGMSTAETAACLDISEDLVKTRLHRGRTRLREQLLRHAGVTLESAFRFGHGHCDRMVATVMESIAAL